MTIETIKIVFEPISGTNIGPGPAYHETLIYTNSSGQSFYCTSGPSNPIRSLVDIVKAIANEHDAKLNMIANTPSYLGVLTADGKVNVSGRCL